MDTAAVAQAATGWTIGPYPPTYALHDVGGDDVAETLLEEVVRVGRLPSRLSTYIDRRLVMPPMPDPCELPTRAGCT